MGHDLNGLLWRFALRANVPRQKKTQGVRADGPHTPRRRREDRGRCAFSRVTPTPILTYALLPWSCNRGVKTVFVVPRLVGKIFSHCRPSVPNFPRSHLGPEALSDELRGSVARFCRSRAS
jgi:hypothetical protein